MVFKKKFVKEYLKIQKLTKLKIIITVKLRTTTNRTRTCGKSHWFHNILLQKERDGTQTIQQRKTQK